MKNITKYLALLFIAALFGFSSCTKEDQELDQVSVVMPTEADENADSLVTVSGIIQGVIYDGSNSSVLAGVTVGYASNGTTGSVTASATGGFSITGLASGEYILTFSKDGYTTVTAYADIPTYEGWDEAIPNGGIWKVTRSVEPAMFPLNAGAKGYLFIDGYPAEGINVQLDYTIPGDLQYAPSLYTTVVDADGYYEFENVPGTMAILTVPSSTFMGYYVNEYRNMYRLNSNAVTSFPVIELYTSDYPDVEIVQFGGETDYYGYAWNYDPKEDLLVTFNQTLDLENSEFRLYDNHMGVYVPITVESTKALNTIKITPNTELLVDNDYYLYYEVKTVDGVWGDGSYEFSTIEGIYPVSASVQEYAGDDGPFYDVPVNGPITVTFNLDIDQEMTLKEGGAYIENDYTGEEVELDIVYDGKQMIITPKTGFEYDSWYYGEFYVYSGYLDDYFSADFEFGTEVEPNPELTEAPVIEFEEDLVVNDNTTSIPVNISFVDGAVKYKIFAKDNYNNTEWRLVTELMMGDLPDFLEGQIMFDYTINLPYMFDYFEDDSEQTPFSHGTEVSFKVVADNFQYETPESNVISIKDKTALTPAYFNFIEQSATADNTSGTEDLEITVSYGIANSFYVDETKLPASVEIFDGASEATTASATFKWVAVDGVYTGVITITVDAGEDASGFELRINGITDASGNVQTDDLTRTLF